MWVLIIITSMTLSFQSSPVAVHTHHIEFAGEKACEAALIKVKESVANNPKVTVSGSCNHSGSIF